MKVKVIRDALRELVQAWPSEIATDWTAGDCYFLAHYALAKEHGCPNLYEFAKEYRKSILKLSPDAMEVWFEEMGKRVAASEFPELVAQEYRETKAAEIQGGPEWSSTSSNGNVH